MRIAWTIGRHTLAWVILAGFALAYLSGLYLFHASGNIAANSPDRTGITASIAASSADRTAASGIEDLRAEIALLRRQMERMGQRNEDLHNRLSSLEAALGPNTASLPPQNAEAGIVKGARQRAQAGLARKPVTVTYSPLPEDGFGDLMIDRSPLPVASSGQTTRTLFGVELGQGKSPEAVRKKWAELGAQHKALLAGLQARHLARKSAGNVTGDVRLLAGPFPNAAEAAQLCASLRAAGTACKEAVFSGKTF